VAKIAEFFDPAKELLKIFSGLKIIGISTH